MSTVYRPVDVLDVQVKAIDWWTRSAHRHGMDRAFQPLLDAYSITSVRSDAVKGVTGKKLILSEFMSDRLNRAETIFVRSRIIDRLWSFTDVYEAHEREVILPQDLPCDRGFVYLEHSIHILDANGQVCSVKGILWSAEPQGVIVVMMSDYKDPLDDINRKADLDHSNWRRYLDVELPVLHIQSYKWGQKVTQLTEADFTVDHRERTPEELDRLRAHMDENVQYANRFNQFMISLWEFMGEQIPQTISPDRWTAKRLKRANSPLKEVTVVELRTTDRPTQHNDPDHVPQEVVWTHRWRSREHKRRWIDKHGNYRETTVSASIKGPEHLPLIEKDRVFHVRK